MSNPVLKRKSVVGLVFAGVSVTLVVLLLSSCCMVMHVPEFFHKKKAETEAASGAEVKTVYTCPMHPDVIKGKPGNCPKCGMKLEAKDI